MQSTRESLDADVVIVGAGPAGLACAIKLMQLIDEYNQNSTTPLDRDNVFLLEKSSQIAQHTLSGALLDPGSLFELLPEFDLQSLQAQQVSDEQFYYLSQTSSFKLPRLLLQLLGMRDKQAQYIISLGQLLKQLAQQAEALGVNLVTGISAEKCLLDQQRVLGVATRDHGRDQHGRPKANFQAGLDIHAPLTVLAEGSYGTLSQSLIKQFQLDRQAQPQHYALGFKEIWQLKHSPLAPGSVWHCAGYPLGKFAEGKFAEGKFELGKFEPGRSEPEKFKPGGFTKANNSSGGGWVYAHHDKQISIGLVVDLNYTPAQFDPFKAFQQFKSQPLIQSLLKDSHAQRIAYGARTLPKGGYWSLPQPYTHGCLILGDSAGFVDGLRLKGIHLAIQSGMLAAQTLFEALLKNNASAHTLASYQSRIEHSPIKQQLWRARHFQQAINQGKLIDYIDLIVQGLSGGRGLYAKRWFRPAMSVQPALSILKASRAEASRAEPSSAGPSIPVQVLDQRLADGSAITQSRNDSLYYSANHYTTDQPANMQVLDQQLCLNTCTQQYANPCLRFCPAGVYELKPGDTHQPIHLNPENCLHCKACAILDPYHNIHWQPPQGGDGPRYTDM